MAVQDDGAAKPHEERHHSSSKSKKRKLDSSSSEKPKKKSRKERKESAQTSSSAALDEAGASYGIADGGVEIPQDEDVALVDSEKSTKKSKKGKSKKSKKDHDDSAQNGSTTIEETPHATGKENEEPVKSKKKDKKKEKKSKKDKSASKDDPTSPTPVDESPTSKDQKHRFILFIGNLPYAATDTAVESHFAKLSPASVRHPTDPSSGKSKGYAFLEFSGFDKMQTCLEKYHHSLFEGRKINVELTAGGGGKSKERKGKLKEKNHKLKEERQKWAEKEKRAKNEKAKKAPEEKPEKPQDDIHPSRRAMIKT